MPCFSPIQCAMCLPYFRPHVWSPLLTDAESLRLGRGRIFPLGSGLPPGAASFSDPDRQAWLFVRPARLIVSGSVLRAFRDFPPRPQLSRPSFRRSPNGYPPLFHLPISRAGRLLCSENPLPFWFRVLLRLFFFLPTSRRCRAGHLARFVLKPLFSTLHLSSWTRPPPPPTHPPPPPLVFPLRRQPLSTFCPYARHSGKAGFPWFFVCDLFVF